MKIDQKKVAILLVVVIDCLVAFLLVGKYPNRKKDFSATVNNKTFHNSSVDVLGDAKTDVEEEIRKASVVWDNLTMDELSAKLERSMNSSLKGKGKLFATYSIELGLDPYLALAITLHETGCAYSCSGLVRTHNNLGGLKGGNGKYMAFPTLDDGIKGYLDILYNRYYSKGLTTPEKMNPVYAQSTTWASKVNWYMNKIKAA